MTDKTESRFLARLPAIFHAYEETAGYAIRTSQLLQPFEDVFAEFEALLATVDRYFAPALTPAEDFLPWLATWLALALDEDWDETKRRRLVSEAAELYRWRGTVRGLRRYLEIYTGLDGDAVEFHEGRWPGGMQIGVASRIGGFRPARPPTYAIERTVRQQPVEYHDYYIVQPESLSPGLPDATSQPKQFHYRTDEVMEFTVGEGYVELELTQGRGRRRHEPATATRRDGLIHDKYTITLDTTPEEHVDFIGDSLLIDEVELPYRFVVDVHVSQSEIQEHTSLKSMAKMRAILDLEKPAHTQYYLKFTQVVSKATWLPKQIEKRSSIGLDTTIG